ncbi:DUF47 family protein [Bacteroidales bacterium OttesenSCG-928-I14]|nr:DUF47 family protein [Bacteroidales bacterium OttesenSCG-928-I14]
MKINTILSIFSPKDTKFFPMLNETASILNQTANLLQDLFAEKDKSRIPEICKQVKLEETKGDKVTGKIFKALNDTFITPFDREDIDAIADTMDDAIDAMNRAAQKVLLYSPKDLSESTMELSKIILAQTVEVVAIVDKLSSINKNDKAIRESIKEVKRLEEKADVIYEEGIMELFNGDADAIEVFKLKEIIQELEKSANKINKIGKVAKTIIVKYA